MRKVTRRNAAVGVGSAISTTLTTPATAAAGTSPCALIGTSIRHVVAFKLKWAPGSNEERDFFSAANQSLDDFPFRAGVPRRRLSGLQAWESPDAGWWCPRGCAVMNADIAIDPVALKFRMGETLRLRVAGHNLAPIPLASVKSAAPRGRGVAIWCGGSYDSRLSALLRPV